jgi:signal transduction histidine kinase
MDPRGYPNFDIKPPGQRPAHEVLIYLEPLDGNEFALGLDIGVTPPQRRAQARTRDTGELVASGRLLNVGKERAVGLAMRLAVYRPGAPLDTVEQRRAAFIGTVGAGYNVRRLMAGVLNETTMGTMRFRLHDAGPVAESRNAGVKTSLLFDSAQTAPGAPQDDFVMPGAASMFEIVLPLELAGRNWQLHFSAPKSAFIKRSDAWLPWVALVGGLVGSALLFAVLYGFASSRERAVALAREITRELRESEASLAHAQALARLGSWTLDTATNAMNWSAETYRVLGLEPRGPVPRLEAFLAWFAEADRALFREALERCVREVAPCSLELPLQVRGAEARWAHLVLQPEAGQVRGTIMDVTERKRALETQRANAAQIRDLLRRLVSVQEAERRRFSANLHDLVGQSLSVIGIGLETIRGLLPGTAPQKAEAAIRDMGQVVRETMGAVREVMSDLRPPLLDDYGLSAALEWHAQQLESRTGLRVAVAGGRLDPRPASEVEVALFRIAQEALTNVAKHAAASRATVALSSSAGRVTLVIEDDGRGFDATAAANDPGARTWGMAVMRERAAAVGGAMRVESPGRGTRIVVEVAA